jgi:predicted site-specific integrase-resolvase
VRPTVYTAAQAAVRLGVSRRTIRQWVADGRLVSVEDSYRKLGYYLFTGPALAEAEASARRGRTRRRRSLT